jgi:hypothetical protein
MTDEELQHEMAQVCASMERALALTSIKPAELRVDIRVWMLLIQKWMQELPVD